MATNKNQHFVPRCYLRPFTMDGADASINLYNLDRKKFIPNAPVKNQCSRDYFYGQDEKLEHAIQLVESGYGSTLRKILSANKIFADADKIMLRTFWLFQHLRTESAALRAVEMSESTRDIAGIPKEDFQLGIKEAVLMACRAFSESMHIVDDLKFCLIRNKTKHPFITSDDPAILTNRWHLEDRRALGRSFGLGSAGAITMLPLSPKLLLLGYDGDVYNVAHLQGVTDIKSERDIIAFNQHQLLNCRANVFVQDVEHSQIVHNAYTAVEEIRPQVRHVIHYAVRDRTEGDHVRYVVVDPKDRDKNEDALLHTQDIHPKPQFWPSQIRIRGNGSVFTNGTGMGYVRYETAMQHTSAPFERERA